MTRSKQNTAKILSFHAKGLRVDQIAFLLGYRKSSEVTKCLQRNGLILQKVSS